MFSRLRKRRATETDVLSLVDNIGQLAIGPTYEFRGLFIKFDALEGDLRPKYTIDNKKTEWPVQASYGEINDTIGVDGDPIDVYVAPPELFVDSDIVYVVNQLKFLDGAFDEHKLMVGFPSVESAKAIYVNSYPPKVGETRVGSIVESDIPTILQWIATEETSATFCTGATVFSTESFGGDPEATTSADTPASPDRRDEGDGEVDILLPRLGAAPIMTMREHPANPGGVIYDVYIYSDFSDDKWGGASDDIVRRMAYATAKDAFVFHIISPGGEVDLAARIASGIRTTRARVVTVAEGLVASAGCLLWSEGHVRCVTPGAVIMQHMSSHGAMGNTCEIAEQALNLSSYIKSVVLTRARSIGLLTEEEVDQLSKQPINIYLSADVVMQRTGAEMISNGK